VGFLPAITRGARRAATGALALALLARSGFA